RGLSSPRRTFGFRHDFLGFWHGGVAFTNFSIAVHRRNCRSSCSAPKWREWITTTAEAAACPPDYVVAPLLASASVLIGHARWAQATPGWREPPHLWLGAVGDSGDGKSPGADCLINQVLPEIERAMLADFPERLREW